MSLYFVCCQLRDGSRLGKKVFKKFLDAQSAWAFHNEKIRLERQLERSVIFGVKFPEASQNFAFSVLDDYKANWRWERRPWWRFWKK